MTPVDDPTPTGVEAKPELAVNRAGRTTAEALNGFITHAATGLVGGASLDSATAFFNVGGYSLIADSLDRLQSTRILLGAEPVPSENRLRRLGVESVRPARAAQTQMRSALEDHERDLTEDRNLLGFSSTCSVISCVTTPPSPMWASRQGRSCVGVRPRNHCRVKLSSRAGSDDEVEPGDEAAGGGGSAGPATAGDFHAPTVTDETLACLHQARPPHGFETPRVLDDDTRQQVFKAWKIARNDIVNRWNHLADKANLEPRVPAAMARAANILRSHPPADTTQDQIDRAIDCLNAPYPERIIRTFRLAIAAFADPAEQADKILNVIQDHGLQPHTPPDALPKITAEDVHLVCWLALS